MPLIVCPDCQTQVSDQALACPKCARPLSAAEAEKKGSSAVSGATAGFIAGFTLVWGGCGKFQGLEPKDFAVCAFGGAIFAILGAILGTVLGGSTKKYGEASMMMRSFGVAVIAVLGGLAGCKGNSAEGKAPALVKVGTPMVLGGISWEVVEASDRGQVLPATSDAEVLRTQGHFVQVHFLLVNKGSSETTLTAPDLVNYDSDTGKSSLHFRPHADGWEHLPPDAENLDRSKAPPNVPKDYWTIYDVAAGVTQLHVWFAGAAPQIDLGALKREPAAVPARSQATVVEACKQRDLSSCSDACKGGDLGSCAVFGGLLLKSDDKAAKRGCEDPLRRACNGMIGRACTNLYSCLKWLSFNAEGRRGEITEADKRETTSLAIKACDLQDGLGCEAAARSVGEGYGIDADEDKARAYAKKAMKLLPKECESGDGDSCFAMAMLLKPGVPRGAPDAARSAALFGKACDAGIAMACGMKGNAGRK